MLINCPDWLRVLKIAASVGKPEVKFSQDGSFGVISGSAFAVFGKSLFLGEEIVFLDIVNVIKNLGCFRQTEINVEVSDGKITFAGDNDKICHCLLSPSEMVPNYKISDLPKLSAGEWDGILLQIEELYHLRDVIKATRPDSVWFYTKNGRLTALATNGEFLWELPWEEFNLPCAVGVWVEHLQACLNCLDVSHISLAFKFTGDFGILRIRQKDEFSRVEFTWFIGMLTEKKYEERQTQKDTGLLLPFKS